MTNLIKLLSRPSLIVPILGRRGFFHWMDDAAYLRISYKAYIGRNLNIENPKTFNEKIQWLKLNNKVSLYTDLVDKIKAKSWVANRIGDEYVTNTYDVWESVDDIDIDSLPERFVLKTNHDSGGIAICSNRSTFNLAAAKRRLGKRLKRNYFYSGREWPYINVQPLVFAEEYLDPGPLKNELVDYKVMCFGGRARCVFTCAGRGNGDLRVDFYDCEWNHLPFARHYPNADSPEPRPEKLEEMIELSERLSSGIPFVRCDFYEVGDRLVFGELTFYPGSGFEEFDPEEWDEILGSWIELPK